MQTSSDLPFSISLNTVGKKYRDRWIFRNLDLDLKSGDHLVITGANGSGKSTLLQLISGYITPSEGSLEWKAGNAPIPSDQYYRHFSFAAPYMDLIENFTLEENIRFYASHKTLIKNASVDEVMETAYLKDHAGKLVAEFSSGMKQRIKLAMAFQTQTQVLLLDEPVSNLDERGAGWYQEMVGALDASRIIIVCSNRVRDEAGFCTRELDISGFALH